MDEVIPPGPSLTRYSGTMDESREEVGRCSKGSDSTNIEHNITILEAHSTKTFSSDDMAIEISQASITGKDYEGKISNAFKLKVPEKEIERNCETIVAKTGNESAHFSKHVGANVSMQPVNSQGSKGHSEASQKPCILKCMQNDLGDSDYNSGMVCEEVTEYIHNSQDNLQGNDYVNANNLERLPVILNVRGNADDFDTSEEIDRSNFEKYDRVTGLASCKAIDLLQTIIDKAEVVEDKTKKDVGKESTSQPISNLFSKERGPLSVSKTLPSTQRTNRTISNNITKSQIISTLPSDFTSISMQSGSPAFVDNGSNVNSIRLTDNHDTSIQTKTANDLNHQSSSNMKYNSGNSHSVSQRLITNSLKPTQYLPNMVTSCPIIGTSSTSISSSSVNSNLSSGNQGNCGRNMTSPQFSETTASIANTQRVSSSAAPQEQVKSQTTDTSQIVLDSENVSDSHYSSDSVSSIDRTSLSCLSDISSNLKVGLNRQDILDSSLLRVSKKTHTDLSKQHVCEVCGDAFYHEEFLDFHLKRNVFKMTYFCTVCSRGMIFSNKCSFLLHIMKEGSNWQEHLLTGKGFMQLMPYIPSGKHEESSQSFTTIASSHMQADIDLLQSSSSKNSVAKVYQESFMTQAEMNNPSLPFEKNSASLSSLSPQGVTSTPSSSILPSGTTFSKRCSIKPSRIFLSHSYPKTQPETSFLESSPLLVSQTVTTITKSSSLSQTLNTIPKSSSSQTQSTIPKSSSLSQIVSTVPKSSSQIIATFTNSSSSQVVATFPTKSLTQIIASIPKSLSSSQIIASIPKSLSSSQIIASIPKSLSSSQIIASIPKSLSSSQIIASIPKSLSSSPQIVASIPKSLSSSQIIASIPKSLPPSQIVASIPKSLSPSQIVASIPKSLSPSQIVAPIPKSLSSSQIAASIPKSSLSQIVASLPKSSLSQIAASIPKSSSSSQIAASIPKSSSQIVTAIPKSSPSQIVATIPKSSSVTQSVSLIPASSSLYEAVITFPKSPSLIPAPVLQPTSVAQAGITFRLPLTQSIIIPESSVSHASDKVPSLQPGTKLILSTASGKSSSLSIRRVPNDSLASVSSDSLSSTAHSKANVPKSSVVSCSNIPSGLQSTHESSPSSAVSSIDSSSDLHLEDSSLRNDKDSSEEKSSTYKYCSICKIGFQHASQFKAHFRSTGPYLYTCNICGMFLFNFCHMAAHKTIHTFEEGKNSVICPECGETLPFSKVIFEHLDNCGHFNVTIGITCHCGQRFPSIDKVKSHILESHLYTLYNCRLCGRAFISQTQLFIHYKRHHQCKESSVSAVVMCKPCDEIYFNAVTLQKHVEKEISKFKLEKQRKYQCMLCDSAFTDSSILNFHMEKKHTHKPKRCTLCFALFKSRQNLVSHIVSKSCEKRLPRKLHICVDSPAFKNSEYHSLFSVIDKTAMASDRTPETQEILPPPDISITSVETPESVPLSSSSTVPKSTAKVFSRSLSEKGKNTSSSHTVISQKSHQPEKRPLPIKISVLDKQKYQCHSCKICLVGTHNYKKHMSHHKSNELNTGRTRCIICKKMIVDSSICSHMEEHQKCGVIICTLCHRRDFANLNAARDHSKNWCYYTVAKGWGEACFWEKQSSTCDRVSMNNGKDSANVDNSNDIIVDPSMEPDSNENQPLLFPCLMCGLAFSTKYSKDEHVSRVHEGTRTLFFCLFCKKRGIRKTFHKRKMASMHITRKHRIVDPSAISKLIHEEKQNISSGQVIPVEAPAEGDKTADDAPPPKRLRIEAEGAFLCGKCGFSDTKADVFEVHIKAHNPKNEPQCPECGLCFTVKTALKKHLFAIHKIKNVEEYMKDREIGDEDEEFISEDEEMETVNVDEVDDNESRVEPRPRLKSKSRSVVTYSSNPLECNVCYRRFSSEAVLKSHIRNHGMAFIRSRRHNKSRSQEPMTEPGPSSSA